MVNCYPVGTLAEEFLKKRFLASYYPEENYWQYKDMLA